jgi:hypothetical protein
MALKTPKSAFEMYVDRHPDLLKDFTDSGSKSKAAYGSTHWKASGRKEEGRFSPASLRVDDTGRATSSAFASAMKGISLADYDAGRRPSRAASTDAWKNRSGEDSGAYALKAGETKGRDWKSYVNTQGYGNQRSHESGNVWFWNILGEEEDYKFRNANAPTKRVKIEMNDERGWAYLDNPEEDDKGKQRWTFRSDVGNDNLAYETVPWVSNLQLYSREKGTDPKDDTYAMGDAAQKNAAVLPKEAAPDWESAFSSFMGEIRDMLRAPATSTPMSTNNNGLNSTQIVKRQLDDPSLKTSSLTMVNARKPAGGMAVVDPATGTVYANPGAARAAGITSWVYKYKYDAMSTGTSTFSAVAT